jgi:hypothetical protein
MPVSALDLPSLKEVEGELESLDDLEVKLEALLRGFSFTEPLGSKSHVKRSKTMAKSDSARLLTFFKKIIIPRYDHSYL